MWDWVRSLFSGKKTYLIGAVMVGFGYYSGNYELALEGLGMMGLRAGLASAVEKLNL